MLLNIKGLRKKLKLSQQGLAEEVGISKSKIGQWEVGNANPKVGDYEKLVAYFSDRLKLPIEAIKNFIESNATDLGPINVTDTTEKIVTKGGNTHHVVNDNVMLLDVPLVENYAYAGYLAGWCDPTYINNLPMIRILVDKVHSGNYRTFEVRGDSMTGADGGPDQVFDGEYVVGRQVTHNHWKSKLHIRDNPVWIIVHEEGILVKNIISHNVEARTITVRSFNEDKQSYPDLELSLNDVYELYNVVQKIRKYNK